MVTDVSAASDSVVTYVKCSSMHVPLNPCKNSAFCSNTGDGQFTCTCSPGYTGNLCEEEIIECASNPCQNGATCVDLVNGYTCNCVAGFTGTYQL